MLMLHAGICVGGSDRSCMLYWKEEKKNTNSFCSFYFGDSCGDAMMKKADAFISIEYSLLIPGILAVFAIIIYMGLYLYNQCILQTNVYLLAVEGSEMSAENNKYILAENIQTLYGLRGDDITIKGSGTMTNPFSIFGMGNEKWNLRAEGEIEGYPLGEKMRLIKKALKVLKNSE